ncbi:restriction endonuclease subunit S [Arcobacter sp. YIC-80]|uniref:restriction endonuclease subunit S n=1 Tax=Arcobacter sp. YIC-80 TaxID=3376683 RepID=UPI00384C5407
MIKKNVLPSNWFLTTIGEIGIVMSGGTPSTKKTEYFGGEVSWITPTDLSKYTNKFISEGKRNITIEGLNNSSAKLLPKGTVLFSSRAPIGYTAIAQKELSTNQGFKNLVTTKSLNSEYVYYYFKTLKPLAEKIASGTTFLELSAQKFSKLPFPLPPLNEQIKIVNRINELFIIFEHQEKEINNILKKLEIYKYSFLHKIFTKKSNSRKIIKIKDLGNILTGSTPTKSDSNLYGMKYNFYKPSDFNWGDKISKSNEMLSNEGYLTSKKVPVNSILVTCIGTIGKVSLVKKEGAFNQQINAIIPSDEFIPEFIFYQVLSLDFQQLIKENTSATTIPIINKTKFSELDFIYYSLDEQKTTTQEIESKFSIIDNLEYTVQQLMEKLKLTKIKILDNAFKGKLISIEESQESAKLLFEKIQNEKKEYLKEKKNELKKQPKKGKTVNKDLSILEIVKKSDNGVLAKDLFLQSKYNNNIEEFYSELKKIEDKIVIENNNKDSLIRIKNEN